MSRQRPPASSLHLRRVRCFRCTKATTTTNECTENEWWWRGLLDSACRSTAPAAPLAAGDAVDDGVKDGDDAVDNGLEHVANAIDDGHDDVADGMYHGTEARSDGTHLYSVMLLLSCGLKEGCDVSSWDLWTAGMRRRWTSRC